MSPRWTYSDTPEVEDWPTIVAKKVQFSEIGENLPESTGVVTAEQRREQIRIRQQHVQKRYRVF
jgi:hypothetical protein